MKQEIFRLLREDEEFRYAVAGLIGLDEILKRLDRNEKELIRLREDMLKGFELMRRHLDALGARWGLMSEEAFREGLRGLLKEELGLKVEKWAYRDEEGMVYGYPSIIDIDVAIRDGKVILVEVTSHARPSDTVAFKKKAELYEKVTGRKPERLLIVTPYADEETRVACKKLGIELYTKI